MNPEIIVQKQVEAYNSRNLSAFLECHHPEVELFTFSEKIPFAVGLPAVRKIYKTVFDSSPNLKTEIIHRICINDKVIDHEMVYGRAGADQIEFIAIYEIKDNLIHKAHFIRKD